MAIVYRLVKGSPLTKAEFDGNFLDVDGRLVALEEAFVVNRLIDDITINGDQLTFHFDDYTTIGPLTLPALSWNPRGTWTAATSYAKRDIVSFGGAAYEVIFNHTSQASFDPEANDGLGNNYYRLLIAAPVLSATPVRATDSTAFNVTATELNKYNRCTAVGGAVITILPDSTLNHDVDSEAHFVQRGGPLTFEAGIGVTLNWPDNFLPVTDAVGAVVTWKKVAANEWDGFGLFAGDPSA